MLCYGMPARSMADSLEADKERLQAIQEAKEVEDLKERRKELQKTNNLIASLIE